MSNLTNPLPAEIPPPGKKRIAVRVTPAAERAVRSGHPWLFENGITSESHAGQAGDLAVLFDRKGRFLAVGLYDPASIIRVRVLHAGSPVQIDAGWFAERLAASVKARHELDSALTNGFRLVHGENDGLPGLVVDRYDRTLVMKLYTPAWVPHLPDLLAGLEPLAPERVVLRLNRETGGQEDRLFGLSSGMVIQGEPISGPVEFLENGIHFAADVVQGQKTGFFLDQRDNRARVEELSSGKRVLNVFAYTGGFSLYAARGGAKAVTSLDISRPALVAAQRNFELNRLDPHISAANHKVIQGDAFDQMDRLAEEKRRYEMVIIDPPSFAKKETEVERAVSAYGRLVRRGLRLLTPEGTLVMASCSSRVPAVDFFNLVLDEADHFGRPLREMDRTEHAADHPVGFKEGAYLKCMFATAD